MKSWEKKFVSLVGFPPRENMAIALADSIPSLNSLSPIPGVSGLAGQPVGSTADESLAKP